MMPTRVRDDVDKKDVADSPNAFAGAGVAGAQITLGHCNVLDAHLFTVGKSFRLIDNAHPNGVSARLEALPGRGMMTATFVQN